MAGLVAFPVIGLVALPLCALVVFALDVEAGIWPHLIATVLGGYARTTTLLAAGVGVGVAAVGVGAAWLVAIHEFPLRRQFEWALMLPLAAPSYIVAFVYTDFLDYTGPVQSGLRALFGWRNALDYDFPAIRTLPGAIVVLVLVLYPYVYLLARTAFLAQSRATLDAARMLGHGHGAAFRRVALPMARPAIVVGVALALMETLNEYGTVDFFAVTVFSTGIYHVWLNMHSIEGAAGLALMLVGAVAGLLWLERRARADRRFADPRQARGVTPRVRLTGIRAWLAMLGCALPVILGFVLPFGLLVWMSWRRMGGLFTGDLGPALLNSLQLSAAAAGVVCLLALSLGFANRTGRSRLLQGSSRVASVGYAIPGSVLAVGVLAPLAAFDNAVDGLMRDWFGVSSGLLLSGSLFALLFGCSARFIAVGHGAIEAGFERIPRSHDDAARLLGCRPLALIPRLHWPALQSSVLTAALLVFVDTMKELPMTLALQPFNFRTLATISHQYASDERFEQAAPAALAIVIAGVIPVILLSRTIRTTARTGG
ncbi:MAG: iron ABC transporter permease [Pseudomonadota bacterium]|nr:iron ABC transporter permease [Pseudomonadota bacterium]